jgi:GDP-mannose 6-dehydrogenase
MNISIIGLGYVGTVSAACLANEGNKIIGVDINQEKIKLINNGISPIIEKNLGSLIKDSYESGSLIATNNLNDAILSSEVSIICVGTPNLSNGDLDMTSINKVVSEISFALKEKSSFLTICIRSTIMPGSYFALKGLIEKTSGKKSNVDFALVLNPEFLREGSAIKDFYHPPYSVISGTSETGVRKIKKMLDFIKAPILEPEINVAELIKFLNNSFHALKVAFANETGRICKSMGINSHELMDLFIKDSQLNISDKYLLPGFSYGGSCLPKDLKAINSLAKKYSLSTPIFNAIEQSNKEHTSYVYKKIKSIGKRKIGFVGLTFKTGTDDLRDSPSLEVCTKLIEEGNDVLIFDQCLNTSKLIGSNKKFLQENLPFFNKSILNDLSDLVRQSQVIILAQNNEKIYELIQQINPKVYILDLLNINNLKVLENYEGISW